MYGVNGINFFLHQSIVLAFLCGYFVIRLKWLNVSVLQHWMEHGGTGTGDELVGTNKDESMVCFKILHYYLVNAENHE